ncbi:hypothetical protein B0I35DRAFT_427386 [Stachybotrys elegans]|uniref:DUF7704 domain-containing protein n=1 Tax=Stachybotrys elegans TaxID=80388 RepID=A0A8K0SY75_9HYPO|nr:hypothetical protein B0I35DRAFT_427386 [Stachybotrys elegans]
MASPSVHVHKFYDIWFKWVDPLTLIPTVYATLFMPEVMLDSFIPAQMSPYNPDHGFLFHQLAALFSFIAVVQGVVLRITGDIKVWRAVNAGILLVDISMLASLYVSLKQQDRLSLGEIRGGDWGNLFFTSLVTLIRVAFLSGVGVSDKARVKRA